jgi:hypothetical protein
MKSIDNITIYSTESYDVEVERKNSNEFIDSHGSSSTNSSIGIFSKSNTNTNLNQDQIQVDSKLEPRYAKTVTKFKPVYSY